jgi:hypothetical protein
MNKKRNKWSQKGWRNEEGVLDRWEYDIYRMYEVCAHAVRLCVLGSVLYVQGVCAVRAYRMLPPVHRVYRTAHGQQQVELPNHKNDDNDHDQSDDGSYSDNYNDNYRGNCDNNYYDGH